jgi:hypothetical protein
MFWRPCLDVGDHILEELTSQSRTVCRIGLLAPFVGDVIFSVSFLLFIFPDVIIWPDSTHR